MGNEAATLRMMDYMTAPSQAFEVVETPQRFAAIVQGMSLLQARRVALVTIALSFAAAAGPSLAQQAHTDPRACTLYLLKSLRSLVRKTDRVYLFQHTLYFFLPEADMQGAQIVQDRLWDALLWRIHNTSEIEFVRPCDIASGFSAYPTPSSSPEQCMEQAYAPSLRSNFGAEKPARRGAARRARAGQHAPGDEELPALARKLGIPYLSLLPRKPSARMRRLVNPGLAQELHCYPLGRERNMLTVAMLDPQDRLALDRLARETGLEIFPVLTHPLALQMALEQLI